MEEKVHSGESPIAGEKDLGQATLQVVDAGTDGMSFEPLKQTKRHLKPRHIQLMSISGSIGTGLFIGIGSSLKHAGPLGLLLGYALYGAMTFVTFNAMGEMVCYLPVDGSFIVFAKRFVDPSFSFALGWIYIYSGATVVAAEASAIAGMMSFWTDRVNSAVWCAIGIAFMFSLNLLSVKHYGEGEFYLSIFKVLLILGIVLFTFITMVGGNPQGDAFGFRHWRDPGPMAEYLTTGSLGRFAGFWSVLLQAAFAFGGPDYISNAAAEAMSPRRTMPLIFRRVIYRLLVFYGIGALCAGILVPSNDKALGGSLPGAGSSPFVLAAVRLQIPALPHIINAVLLTSILSCGAEVSFSVSRSLYSMALNGTAPRFLTYTTRGVPLFAVIAVNSVGFLSFLTASNSASVVFGWIVSLCGSAGLLIQALLHIIYIRWWYAVKAQGLDRSRLPFRRRGQIYFSWIVMVMYLIVLLTNGFTVFTHGRWSVSDFLFAYVSIAAFVVPLLGHKLYHRSWRFPAPADVDITSGVEEIEKLALLDAAIGVTRGAKFSRWFWG